MPSSVNNAQDALSVGAEKSKKFYTLQVSNVKIESDGQTGSQELASVYVVAGGKPRAGRYSEFHPDCNRAKDYEKIRSDECQNLLSEPTK